jgi:hypothetical protein
VCPADPVADLLRLGAVQRRAEVRGTSHKSRLRGGATDFGAGGDAGDAIRVGAGLPAVIAHRTPQPPTERPGGEDHDGGGDPVRRWVESWRVERPGRVSGVEQDAETGFDATGGWIGTGDPGGNRTGAAEEGCEDYGSDEAADAQVGEFVSE